MSDLAEDLRLVLPDPKQLGQGEVGQRRIGGEVDEPRLSNGLGKPIALRLGALVTPDERRAEHRAARIEHDATVHLPGKADRFHLQHGAGCEARGGGFQGAQNGLLGGPPPVLRILLGPADVFGMDRSVIRGVRSNDGAAAVDEQGTGPPCADVNSQKHE